MKKSSHTMERNIGIYVFGLLVFLAISCSQDVLAITTQDLLETPSYATAQLVNGVTLNVKAANSTTNTPLYNKIFFAANVASNLATNVPLVWNEKAVFNGSNTADAEARITITTKVAGDLIVKVDMISATTTGGITVTSQWLKYKSGQGPFETRSIMFADNLDSIEASAHNPLTTLNKGTLSTLTLADSVPADSIIPLFDFFTKCRASMHVIITAVLVNDVSVTNPQVLGVDVQSIFFNYIDTTVSGWALTVPRTTSTASTPAVTPIWLDLIQAGGSGS